MEAPKASRKPDEDKKRPLSSELRPPVSRKGKSTSSAISFDEMSALNSSLSPLDFNLPEDSEPGFKAEGIPEKEMPADEPPLDAPAAEEIKEEPIAHSPSADLDADALLKQTLSESETPVPEKSLLDGASTDLDIDALLKQTEAETSIVGETETISAPSVSTDLDVETLLKQTPTETPTDPPVKPETEIAESSRASTDLDIEALLKQTAAESPLPESVSSVKPEEIVADAPPLVSAEVSSDASASADLDVEALLTQVQSEEVVAAPAEGPAPVTESDAATADLDIDAILKQTQAEAPQPVEENDIEALLKASSTSSQVSESPSPPIPEESRPVENTASVSGENIKVEKIVPVTLSEKVAKEFDISHDADVIEMKARMKEKTQDLLKNFVSYKTFSMAFIRQIPKVFSRRRKARQVLREFTEWVEAEKMKIQKIEDSAKKAILEKATIVFEHEMKLLRRKGREWMAQGWRKSFLLLVWGGALGVGIGIGVPSVLKTYLRKPLKKEIVQEMPAETIPVAEEKKKEEGPLSYVLLSCEASQMGKLGKIRVYDHEGKEVAIFPAAINPLKKRVLTPIPSGDCGVLIETSEYPIVGSLEMVPNQRRFIDLSKWTDPEARALINIQSSPEGMPILVDGAWVGKGFAKAYLIAGVHRIWASLPNFPPQEQHLMVADDREQEVEVSLNMGRFIFNVSADIRKAKHELKIMVNGSMVSHLDSYPVLSGYHLVKIMDGAKLVSQNEVKLDAADEAVFQIQKLSDGQLSASLIEKRSAIGKRSSSHHVSE